MYINESECIREGIKNIHEKYNVEHFFCYVLNDLISLKLHDFAKDFCRKLLFAQNVTRYYVTC